MNLVGKIFVVLIFILSLVFMSTAVMVYATHRNWKDEIFRAEAKGNLPKGLVARLDDAKKDFDKLTEEKATLERIKKEEEAAHVEQLAKLQSELLVKKQELAEATKQRDDLLAQNRKMSEDNAVANQNLTARTKEVETLRNQIRVVQSESDTRAKDVVVQTEKNNELVGQYGRLNERNGQLAEQLAKARVLLAKVGMGIDTPPSLQPPAVDGIVIATSGSQNDLLEISLGSDDGLRVGHTIDVYREGKYLARAEIKKIDSNRAVASVDPKIHLGPIQKGDRVTTRIKT